MYTGKAHNINNSCSTMINQPANLAYLELSMLLLWYSSIYHICQFASAAILQCRYTKSQIDWSSVHHRMDSDTKIITIYIPASSLAWYFSCRCSIVELMHWSNITILLQKPIEIATPLHFNWGRQLQVFAHAAFQYNPTGKWDLETVRMQRSISYW